MAEDHHDKCGRIVLYRRIQLSERPTLRATNAARPVSEDDDRRLAPRRRTDLELAAG